MKVVGHLARVAVVLLLCGVASAATLLNVTDTLAAGDPTQQGRLSRNGIPQDWVGTELFPGVVNTGTTYLYRTYAVNVGAKNFVQISFDDVATSEFVSAYLGAYLPNSAGAPDLGFDTNWLGDAGTSGNFFGTDPLFFQVLVPANSTLLLVVNSTGNPPTHAPYNLLVEGFYDQNYDDVPEPSGAILMTGALVALGIKFGRRIRKPASVC